jgi:WD40 repeat protein
MRRGCWLLVWLVVPALSGGRVVAEEKADKPILVLDARGHTGRVEKVLFTPDGKELITVSDDKTIRFWDAVSGEPLWVLRLPIGVGREGLLYAAALSPDGKMLAVGGIGNPADKWGTIYLISLTAGRIERVLKGHESAIFALAFSPDGKRLASGCQHHAGRIWTVSTGECEQTLKGQIKGIHGIAFSPDGKRLVTASEDSTARIWLVATGEEVARLPGHAKAVRSVAWSPDGKTIATGSDDESIRLWDGDGWTPGGSRKQFDKLGNFITSVTFTADSRQLLFTRGGKGSLNLACSLLDLADGKERVRFTRHSNSVLQGALSPEDPSGAPLAATGDTVSEIHVWKTADATSVHRLTGGGQPIRSTGWSKDGQRLAWGNRNTVRLERTFSLPVLDFGEAPDNSFGRAQPTHGSVSLAEAGDRTVAVKRGDETVTKLKLPLEYNTVRCFTLLSDDRAAIGANYGLYLFDTRTGKQLREFQGHTGVVWAVAPSPDNRYLLSASSDQTLRIWDPDHEEPLLSLFFAGNDWIAWTPEGYYAASANGEKLMGWHVNNGPDRLATFYPAAQFHASLYRPDVIKLLLQAGSVEKALTLADKARGKSGERTEVRKVLPPKVTITSPQRSGQRLPKAELQVEARAESVGDHPVLTLRLLLDGRTYEGEAAVQRIAAPKLGEVRKSWTVMLTPGKHRLAVQAKSAVSQGNSDEVEVIYAGEERPEVELPALYVLAVGISAYSGDLKLNYAAHDAEAVERTFKEKSKPLFRKIETKLLTDKAATQRGIKQGLTWLRKQMTQRDVAVFFFSGHGGRDSDGRFYLLPVDVDAGDLLSTAVPDDDLKKALAGMPGRVLALLDACHAGAVEKDKRKSALTDDLVRDLVTDDFGVIVMCSAMGREFAQESNEHRHGFFTQALVEGLSGKAEKTQDGAIYLHKLDAYVTDRVKELARGQQHPVTAKPASIRSFPLSKP